MKLKIFFTLLCPVLLLAASCDTGNKTGQSNVVNNTAPSASPAPGTTVAHSSAEVVKVSAQPVELSAGGAGEATVEIQVASGFHINANPPTFPYLKPAEVEVQPANNVTPGKPVYPSPVKKKFEFEQQPLAVYEGTAQVKVPLRAAANAQKIPTTMTGVLRVQACDDSKCYPPGTVNFPLQVTVK